MNLHTVLVSDDVAARRPSVGSDDDAVFEDGAANGRARFRRFRGRHRTIVHQKGVSNIEST